MSYTPVASQPALAASVLAALRWHETDNEDAIIYAVSFAGDGQSGGSFGGLQNDCRASRPALAVFTAILQTALVPAIQLGRVLGQVSVAQAGDPLSDADRKAVNAALSSIQGRGRVDALDREVFATLLPMLDQCQAAAAENGGATLLPGALMALAIWINASGAPSTVLHWLRGQVVIEYAGQAPAAPFGQPVGADQIVRYLAKTKYFTQYPKQLARVTQAVAIGQAALAA